MFESYTYAPIIAIRPSEMMALKELPDKDKSLFLPVFKLKGWGVSENLENTPHKIKEAIGDNFWIADIDNAFLKNATKIDGRYKRNVFYEISDILSSKDGYDNWFRLLQTDDYQKAIPSLQLGDTSQLESQIRKLSSLERGLSVIFTLEHLQNGYYLEILSILKNYNVRNLIIFFDYGQVTREILTFSATIATLFRRARDIIGDQYMVISCSSFPSSFSGYASSENSIYERQLFQNIQAACSDIRMIYSDRGGARAQEIGGGGGVPSPRIDYPLTNEWKFIRKEFEDPRSPKKGEKDILFVEIAKEIQEAEYWNENLYLWGTQMIELTSKENLATKNGNNYGINSAQKATAVRLNIHIHQQIHYNDPVSGLDTDEDWDD